MTFHPPFAIFEVSTPSMAVAVANLLAFELPMNSAFSTLPSLRAQCISGRLALLEKFGLVSRLDTIFSLSSLINNLIREDSLSGERDSRCRGSPSRPGLYRYLPL